MLAAVITIAFLGTYAATQLLAGSKALHAIFGFNDNLGVLIGTVIVVSYCFAGGIRASIWTDAVQSIVMVVAMFLLTGVALHTCGGFSGMWQQLGAIDPILIDVIPQDLKYGFGLFLLSWIVAGVGVVGQPHIMVRAMVVDAPDHIGLVRNIYAISYVFFSASALVVGLAARVLLPDLIKANGDPTLAFPQLAIDLLPALLIGVILAGIFSAVISTADSQILSCSAALTQDLFPAMGKSYRLVKVGTLIVTAIVLAIALASDKNLIALGFFAWSALGSGLGPILMLRVWKLPVQPLVGVSMMAMGIVAAALWSWFNLSAAIYEVLPGMLAGFLVYGLSCLLGVQKLKTLN